MSRNQGIYDAGREEPFSSKSWIDLGLDGIDLNRMSLDGIDLNRMGLGSVGQSKFCVGVGVVEHFAIVKEMSGFRDCEQQIRSIL